METHMTRKQWKWQWKNQVTPTRWPGVFQRKEGGYIVRARVTDRTTGRLTEIRKVLPEVTEEAAVRWLVAEKARVRAGASSAKPHKMRFSEFAALLFERKVALRKLKSRASRDRWAHTLQHLVAGTTSDDGEVMVPGFGDIFIDQLDRGHVEAWQVGIQKLIAQGHYAPTTANGWLSILKVICKAARRDFGLRSVATEGIESFDTSEHVFYSEENPNALTPEQVPVFLAELKRQYPQHYAMAFLGLATGLRPSSLRPIRRAGAEPDVLWNESRILVRRSQTKGEEVMNTTKQKRRYSITVPEAVLEVLRWHVETQLVTPEQQDSDLLFPSLNGGFRASTVLNKPFAEVSETIGLGFAFTQRGMRRTFNDLARAANVEALITRSISGHLTEQMQHHYSTVQGSEQRDGIARVISLLEAREARRGGVPLGTDRNAEVAPSAVPSGAPGGAPTERGGTPKEKTG